MTPLELLNHEGFVVLPGVVEPHAVKRLHGAASRLAAASAHRKATSLGSGSHFGVACPLVRPFVDLLSCDALLELTTAYLGDDITLLEVMLNIARRYGSADQPIHADEPLAADGPTAVVWNVALHALGPDNGMTELYATTHRGRNRAPDGYQPELGPGDVLVRDASLLHRGRANRSDQQRLLLGIGVTRRPLQPAEVQVIDLSLLRELPATRRSLFAQHAVSSGTQPAKLRRASRH
jgi:ectoine hydroxylase-related dioxygenase (phytanoyl-CoA dioxygenase family)